MRENVKTIVFRADGNQEIGLGHITRCTALASVINNDFNCILATRCKTHTVLEEAFQVFSEIVELPDTDFCWEAAKFSEKISRPDLIVLDGYSFDDKYQENLLRQKFDFFSIDDIHATSFFSKVIINHGGGVSPLDYSTKNEAQFYLGPRYSILRKAFLDAAKRRRTIIDNRNCFVCFGGADPGNKTLEVLNKPEIQDSFDHFHVVVGSAYQQKNDLMKFVHGKSRISFYSSVSAENIVSIMQQCCFAICSPSTIAYEFMSVGGIVFLEKIADNQTDIMHYAITEKLAFPLDHLSHDEGEFKQVLEKQALYFDGHSDSRLRKIFKQYFESQKMTIRKVTHEDLAVCFQWANDEGVREQSYNQTPISIEEHTMWFNKKLQDENIFFYILEIDYRPVGQIRFHVEDSGAVLGYLLDKSIRGRGLGAYILTKGIETFISDYGTTIQITAYVKDTNVASQISFERLAFRKENCTEHPHSFKYIRKYDY